MSRFGTEKNRVARALECERSKVKDGHGQYITLDATIRIAAAIVVGNLNFSQSAHSIGLARARIREQVARIANCILLLRLQFTIGIINVISGVLISFLDNDMVRGDSFVVESFLWDEAQQRTSIVAPPRLVKKWLALKSTWPTVRHTTRKLALTR